VTEELRILVKAESRRAVQELKALETQSGKVENSTSKMALSFLKSVIPIASATAAFAGLVAIGRESLAIFTANEQAAAKLSSVLRATGGAAGISAGELATWRQELYESTLLTTQQIDEMSTLLLTFRNISDTTFPRAQRAVADMSIIFGSLDSSAMQLGRALQDPITGISALRQVGITFSAEQENQIRTFTELNDLASAQAVILSEIENQVGGTAQAMTELSTAGFDRMGRAINDLKSSFGAFIAENFGPTINALALRLEQASALMNRNRTGRSIVVDGAEMTSMQDFDDAIEYIQNRIQAITRSGDAFGLLTEVPQLLAVERQLRSNIQGIMLQQRVTEQNLREETEERVYLEQILAKEKSNGAIASAESLKRQLDIIEVVEETVKNYKELAEEIKKVLDDLPDLVKEFDKIEKAMQGDKLQDWAAGILEAFQEIELQFGGVFDAANGLYSAWGDLEQNRHDRMMANLNAELNERMAYFDEEIRLAQRAGENITDLEQARINERQRIEEEIAAKQEEFRRKSFDQRKAEAIATATMQSALAIINTLATVPGPLGIAAAAGVGALTAGQVALIASQQYPALAEGGVTTGPTMAMIGEGGEPEMVLPLSKAKQMGFGGSGVTIVINGDVIGVPRDEFYRNLEQRIRSLQRIGVA
jgi:hypothetical protein